MDASDRGRIQFLSNVRNESGENTALVSLTGYAVSQDGLHTGLDLGKAVAAVDGPIGLGLERHTSLAAAGSADSREVLTGATGRVLTGVTARLAALGLVLEAALSVELLLTGSENKFVAAFLAYQGLVLVHFWILSLILPLG